MSHVRKLAGLVLLPGLLSACAMLPQHLPKNAKVAPASAPVTPQGMATSNAWPQADWWRALHDRQLDHWVEQALANNPDLHAAGARVLAAQADVGLANARRLPHFNANLSFTQQYFSAQGLHLSANGTSNFFTSLNPLQIQYHVSLWGRDRALVQAARGEKEMAEAEQAQTRLLLSTAVVLHYSALLGDEQVLGKEQVLHRVQQRILALSTVAYRIGVGDATGMLQARLALAQSSKEIASLTAAIAAQRHALAALLGEGPCAKTLSTPRVQPLSLPQSELPKDLPLGLLARRPDIVAARWAAEAAAAQVHAARAAFYPDLNLRLMAGWNSIHLADLFDPANFAHAVGPVLTLPIFEGGALRAQLRGQNAGFLAAQDAYQGQILAALRQVADVLSAWTKLRQQRAAQAQAVEAAQRQVRLTAGAWRSGTQPLLPSLQSQVRYLLAEEANIRLETRSVQNWAMLESALGGGVLSMSQETTHGQ